MGDIGKGGETSSDLYIYVEAVYGLSTINFLYSYGERERERIGLILTYWLREKEKYILQLYSYNASRPKKCNFINNLKTWHNNYLHKGT